MDRERFRLRIYLALLAAVMVFGTIGFIVAEGRSPIDAFYFTIVTIATVGYGDIHPATQGGKILAIILIVTGVGTFLGVIATATEVMLNRRERQVRLAKVNMVMGLFFSEVGTRLLSYFAGSDSQVQRMREDLRVTSEWSGSDFVKVRQRLQSHDYRVEMDMVNLGELLDFLRGKTNLLVRLLENPHLLERESFTELLRAVFHLSDELLSRDDVSRLPEADRAHLAGDIQRAYGLLARQWLDYMEYLQGNYPYLFSLAMRTNPFDQKASAVVQ